MSNLSKGLILVAIILLVGVGLVIWKNKVGHASESFNSISKSEIELLLGDVAKTNPAILKRLKDDPKMKEEQIKNLKQLLGFASQAQRDGITAESAVKHELEDIRYQIIAMNYDKELNKDKGPMPQFGFISEEQVQAYWQSGPPTGGQGFLERIGLGGPSETRTPEQQFEDFVNAKIELMKRGNPDSPAPEITDEQRNQARDLFAKTRLYKGEFDQKVKSGELSREFVDKSNLQVKLQQAQFLARLYAEKAADQTKVTDEEIAKYIVDHPEFDPAAKRAKAQELLDRAKAGEDFAALANEFSEDPGNKGPDGTGKGGLYADVPKGRMVPPFEAAALSVEPGQIAPELVETDFGFHIVKLERKLGPSPNKGKDKVVSPGGAGADGDTYDVRHILISTGIKDPDNPMARDVPVKEYARTKLEEEKKDKLLEQIVSANNVHVAEDWEIPEVTDEQIQQMRQRNMPPQMQPPPTDGGDAPPPDKPAKPAANKPADKKK